MKTLEVKAGERMRIVHKLSNSMPSTIRFTAEAVDGTPATGMIEIAANKFPGNKVTETRPLEHVNIVEKKMSDSWFSIFVTVEQDTRILFERSQTQSSKLVWALLAVIVIGVIAAVVPLLAN